MKKRIISLLAYSCFWLALCVFARLLFILAQYKTSFEFRIDELTAIFLHGIKLDLSVTAYFIALPALFLIVTIWIQGNWYKTAIKWYSFFLIALSSVIIVVDAVLYSYWGFRMDYTPFTYLKTPTEAMASVSLFKIILCFLAILSLVCLFIALYKKIINKFFGGFDRIKKRIAATLFFTLLFASLIIPIRGGVGIAPINAGTVYFSPKMFLNHAAVNVIWNVGTTAFGKKPIKNPYQFEDKAVAAAIVDSLLHDKGNPMKVLNNQTPNILIIALESFSGYTIGALGGDSTVTPCFNKFAEEGILFTEFYASGNRTDKGMPAILNGYPAQPTQSIIKEPKKSQSLPSLVRILTERGYNSSFWYGGDINFANFKSFVIGSGFQNLITKNNFSSESYNSKWGVHDHILFNALKDSMQNPIEPFLTVVLTLSSHEPFDVPMETVIKGSDNMSKYKNSVFYADKSLGEFINWAKTTDWWQTTLVILVADHCGRASESQPVYSPELFKIPMLWMGGALDTTGLKITKYGDQTDIPLTVLGQLGIDAEFPFGKNLLSPESASFSFYVYNEGLGFLTDTTKYIYDHKMKSHIVKEDKGSGFTEKTGKAYLQVLFDDYLERGK